MSLTARGEAGARIRPEDHLALVRKVCRRYACPGRDPDDLFGAAAEGLLKAARSYDPARGPWGPHATVVVRQTVRAAARAWKLLPQEEEAGAVEVRGIEAVADYRTAAPTLERLEARELLQTLPQSERAVISLLYGLDDGIERTHIEVGKLLGISGPRVGQICARALSRLRTKAGVH